MTIEAQYLTPQQVADLLGVDRTTVYQWLRSGELQALRFGHRWRIKPEDVETFGKKEAEKWQEKRRIDR